MLLLAMLAAAAATDKDALAPTGALRVGVYPGSPTSMVTDAKTGQTHGLAHDLGAELARRLGVRVSYVIFQRVADIVDAIKQGKVDFTLTHATSARANDVAFSPTVIAVELGYLVPAASPIWTADQIDRPGVRIGVTKASTSEHTLPAKFKAATFVSAENVTVAVDLFRRGEIDVYATNKPTLFEISDAMPGARILDGNWGLEQMAIAVPKGRDAGMPAIAAFVHNVQSSGLLQHLQQDAGLRGAIIQQAPK